jgi:D-serine deaminase-like pyridoxal phosphate-dependent protein
MSQPDDQNAAVLEEARLLHQTRSFDVNELELPTPYLLIDDTILSRNIERMAAYCREHNIALRPHTKTHKSLAIAQRQLAAGAAGLAVAKSGEARVMAETGVEVLIAYPPITPHSLATINELRRKVDIMVTVDSLEAVHRLAAVLTDEASPVGVLVDIDLGLKRTGVGTPDESKALAQRIVASKSLRLDGLLCYPGHISETGQQQIDAIIRASQILHNHLACWAAHDLPVRIVSGGSTPTAYNSHLMEGITEIRPGSYVFNDANTVRGGHCQLADCAARVVTTVVSNAVSNRIVVDAGSKTLTRDPCFSHPESGYGILLEYPAARITSLNEEHGVIDVSQCAQPPQIGERISIIPNHICPAVNLTDVMWLRTIEGMIHELPVDARGMVR